MTCEHRHEDKQQQINPPPFTLLQDIQLESSADNSARKHFSLKFTRKKLLFVFHSAFGAFRQTRRLLYQLSISPACVYNFKWHKWFEFWNNVEMLSIEMPFPLIFLSIADLQSFSAPHGAITNIFHQPVLLNLILQLTIHDMVIAFFGRSWIHSEFFNITMQIENAHQQTSVVTWR